MGRTVSPETQLRAVKAQLKELHAIHGHQCRITEEYRARATKAEQEAKEWKDRFDLLLKRSDGCIGIVSTVGSTASFTGSLKG